MGMPPASCQVLSDTETSWASNFEEERDPYVEEERPLPLMRKVVLFKDQRDRLGGASLVADHSLLWKAASSTFQEDPAPFMHLVVHDLLFHECF